MASLPGMLFSHQDHWVHFITGHSLSVCCRLPDAVSTTSELNAEESCSDEGAAAVKNPRVRARKPESTERLGG